MLIEFTEVRQIGSVEPSQSFCRYLDARHLAATINRDLIKSIIDLNLGPRENYPSLVLGIADDGDINDFVDMVTKLDDQGMRSGQRTVLDKLGFAQPDAGEPVLHPSRAPIAGA